jgi:hypothetical protein
MPRIDGTVTNTDGSVGTFSQDFTFTFPAPVVTSISPTAIAFNGGTPMTITGTGFRPGVTVAFDGRPATAVLAVSATQITCISPSFA